MNFNARISQYQCDFSESEKKISDYISENTYDIMDLSAQKLGEETGTSAASIVRFSKKLGFKGFRELKFEIAKSFHEKDEVVDDIISEDDSILEITNKVASRTINVINDTKALIDLEELEKAIYLIRNAECIYLFGVGASSLVAMDLMHKLIRINKKVLYNADPHLQLSAAVHITPKDVAIGISYSGRTKEVNEGVLKAIEKGANTISITSCNKNPLSKISKLSLKVPNVEKHIRFGAISSRMAQLMLVDILYLAVAVCDIEKVEEALFETRKIVEKLR